MDLKNRVKKLEEKKGIAGAVETEEFDKIANELFEKIKAGKEEDLKKGIIPGKMWFEKKEDFSKRLEEFYKEKKDRVLNTPESELTRGELIFKKKCLKELEKLKG
jgi:hypothetical protein